MESPGRGNYGSPTSIVIPGLCPECRIYQDFSAILLYLFGNQLWKSDFHSKSLRENPLKLLMDNSFCLYNPENLTSGMIQEIALPFSDFLFSGRAIQAWIGQAGSDECSGGDIKDGIGFEHVQL